MLADRQGQVAAQYELPGLPYTVVFDPQGKVAIRHPGALTAEQLDYVLNTLTEEAPSGS
jgi:predicted transcriptional regulator